MHKVLHTPCLKNGSFLRVMEPWLLPNQIQVQVRSKAVRGEGSSNLVWFKSSHDERWLARLDRTTSHRNCKYFPIEEVGVMSMS
jgi:hypothetical protein